MDRPDGVGAADVEDLALEEAVENPILYTVANVKQSSEDMDSMRCRGMFILIPFVSASSSVVDESCTLCGLWEGRRALRALRR